MTVVDYPGAAAHPLRNTADTNPPPAQNRLYTDAQRGDAGVRVRREILFQLDLSLRKRHNLQRVFVAGLRPPPWIQQQWSQRSSGFGLPRRPM